MSWRILQQESEVLAVHAALLHTGKIVYFSGDEHDPGQHDQARIHGNLSAINHTRVFDCASNAVTATGSPPKDLFCCGHAFLGDGRLLVAGGTAIFLGGDPGHHHAHFPGLREAWILDPATLSWQAVALMNLSDFSVVPGRPAPPRGGGRWYPTLVTLANGDVIALSGHPAVDDERHNNTWPEIFHANPAPSGKWTLVGGGDPGLEFADYPRIHLLPNGDLFSCNGPSGTGPSKVFKMASGTWHSVGNANAPDAYYENATSVMLPLLPDENYRPRILLCGQKQPLLIDLSHTTQSTEHWNAGFEIAGLPTRLAPGSSVTPLSRHEIDASLYAVDQNGAVLSTFWNGRWNNWFSIGGLPVPVAARSSVAALSRNQDDASLYVVGTDGKVYSTWWNGTWQPWFAIDGLPVRVAGESSVSVLSRHSTDASLYVVGADGKVYSTWWNGKWQPWSSIDGLPVKAAASSTVAVLSRTADDASIYVLGADGQVYSTWWNGKWQPWFSIGGLPTAAGNGSSPSVLSRNAGDASLYVVGNDGKVYSNWWNGKWQSWSSIDGLPVQVASNSSAAVLSRHPNDASIYIIGTDGKVHSTWWDGTWHPWLSIDLPQPAVSRTSPSILSRVGDDASLYVAGVDGKAYSAWWSKSASAEWLPTAPRTLPGQPERHQANAVLLPTGEVFVCGGVQQGRNGNTAVMEAELYTPDSGAGKWSVLPPAVVRRNYHSVALLMPDGAVWTAGSNHHGKFSFTPNSGDTTLPDTFVNGKVDNREPRIEIFEPWYFGRADRPVITSHPTTISVGAAFDVDSPSAGLIAHVNLLRCGSVTHGFNADQRCVSLKFSVPSAGRLKVIAPPNRNVAPPGWYLLYLLTATGVPSKGSFVKVAT